MALPSDGLASRGRESWQVDSPRPESPLTVPIRTNDRITYGVSWTCQLSPFDETIREWVVQAYPCMPTLRTTGTDYGRTRPLALSPPSSCVANIQKGEAHALPGCQHLGTDLHCTGAQKEATMKDGPIFTRTDEYRRNQSQGFHLSCNPAPAVRGLGHS
jgi:hypothetical protein